MLHKKVPSRFANFNFLKIIHMKQVCLCFKLNFLRQYPKNNPWMDSPQQNKKAVLTTAAHFKVSTLERS